MVKNLLLLLLCLVLVSCSKPNDCAGILLPPPAFDHPPAFPIVMHEDGMNLVATTCATMGDQREDSESCYRSFPPLIELAHVDGVTETYARQACHMHHEWGHVNGAPPDHRGWILQ